MSAADSMTGVRALRDALAGGERSAREVAQEALDRAAGAEALNAFLTLDEERVLAQADALDAKRSRGEAPGPLHGVPVAIKDNLCVEGEATTCASRILQGFRPFYDAEVIRRLREAGALLFGKTNMDEFAMGSSGENSAHGATRNPLDPERVPGGSSSGSAAAVGAGIVPAALGSDTGGSIRQPAAFCGIVGFKPTWGRVSRRGLVAFASSLDQVGPMTRSVEDAALLYRVLAGHDADDSTSAARVVEPLDVALQGEARGLRVGVPQEYLAEGLAAPARAAVESTLTSLREAGAEIVEIALPQTRHAIDTYYIIACAEASSNLARFDGVRYGYRSEGVTELRELYARSRTEGFGPEVRRRIMLGTYVLSAGYYDAYYRKAQQVRALFCRDFEEAFARCDVILTPTTPSPAFRIGERVTDPLEMYLADLYTIPANLAGLPAISLPVLPAGSTLPCGVQLLAAPFAEPALFRAAAAVEALRGPLSIAVRTGGAA